MQFRSGVLVQPIFISYSSRHRKLTCELVDVIEAQYGAGSVWWDHELESRGSYSEQIKAALEKARVVVVIWTRGAMISDYVYAEAVSAQAQGKLVNVRPTDMPFGEIPEPFNIHHIDEIEDHAGILATIAKIMVGTPLPTRVPLYEIYFRQHGHRLLDPKQCRLARDPLEVSPTDLLQAKFEMVGYVDATGLKAQLLDWCEDRRPVAARLIHGPGGLGKTRLLIEVAAALRRQGWTTGFFERAHEQVESTLKQRWQALDQLIAQSDDQGLLIVIDYAEGRQDEVRRIAERLCGRSDDALRPLRLVLLARSAGDWWTALYDEMPELQRLFSSRGGASAVVELQPFDAEQDRLGLFEASLEAFEPLLGAQGYELPTADPGPERRRRIGSGEDYSRPLAIQMEALLWLAGAAPNAGLSRIDELLSRVLGLERSHWRMLAGPLDDDGMRDLARGVAQLTAVQGVPSERGTERILMADAFYQGLRTARATVEPVARKLYRLYGRDTGAVAPLEPDLIGEHHVALVGDAELIDGCLSWIEAEPIDTRSTWRRRLLTVLQRATQPEHGTRASARACTLLDRLVVRHTALLAEDLVAVIVDVPGALADRVVRQVDTFDDDALEAIASALPQQSLSLMDLAYQVAARRTRSAREHCAALNAQQDATNDQHGSALGHLAASLDTLSIRLSDLGRREEALAASQEAIEIRRELARTRRDAFLPDLATSLNNTGAMLFGLGHREEALAASQEAIEIRRELARTRPDAFLPDLAVSLNNVGLRLSDLGRREEALAASHEAVALYRGLARTRPDAFLPDLAEGLNNSGVMLSGLGRRAEALAASQEAVELYRELACTRPDAFVPDLAGSLNNVGLRLSDFGHREEALAASQESVELYRELARTRPDAFLPHLAASLNNTGAMLSDLGRREEALATSREAVEIRRDLARTLPDAFLPDLAGSLNNTGAMLSDLDRREEALAVSQEALEIRRELARTRPDAFLPDLAVSLNNVGLRLSDLGRREEALAASQEAVEIRRELARTRPDAFLPELATSLAVTSTVLFALDRHVQSANAASEALRLVAPFVERCPLRFGELARFIRDRFLKFSEAAGLEPDIALLDLVAQALGEDPVTKTSE